MQIYAIGDICRNMLKYALENMQKYEDLCGYMQTKICRNMQIYACQKYAKICNLYALYKDICNRKYMQKYAEICN